MNRFKSVVCHMLRPGALWPLPIALLGIGLLVFVFISELQDTLFGNITYPVTLYAMAVLAIGFPDIITNSKTLISRNMFGNRYINDGELRARISLYQSLFINLVFVTFYAYASWRYASIWFGAVAVYYIILSVMRFILLRSVRDMSLRKNRSERLIRELHTYRFCGCLMFVLNLGMTGMIIQMIWQNKGYQYPGLIIYASAVYAFYSLITAIINMVKFHRLDSPVLSAAKMLGFARAIMSMFALQTAMISQFGAGDDDFRQIMNTASGGGVFVIVFCMAIFMVVRANRELVKIRINDSETKPHQIKNV